ncbi:MAG: hypothetical protein K8F25_14355, partial [Fimbriimonadaceae bacterium]|nr:hypothetical protein [Alphaproteobacteria bacterium]
MTDTLVAEIEQFCRRTGIAESTFGKRAVNDGKFVGRLREGKRVTTATVVRVRNFMAAAPADAAPDSDVAEIATAGSAGIKRAPAQQPRKASAAAKAAAGADVSAGAEPGKNKTAFRFYDNRQKYLMFVNTCGEKWKVAERVGMELAHIRPNPPALRLFDAGMGDGTVLANVIRHMHRRFPTYPFYIVGKEISLEDVRLSLEKMPDRLFEHPATVLVVTNLYYTEAPWLAPRSMQAAATLNWIDMPLAGNTAHEFHEQIKDMQELLAESWQVEASAKTGNPHYVRPSVMVIYREDHKFILDSIIPRPGTSYADYDLVIASQP